MCVIWLKRQFRYAVVLENSTVWPTIPESGVHKCMMTDLTVTSDSDIRLLLSSC